jgi:hypothetical protein
VDPQPLAFRPQDDAPFARVPLVNRFTIDDPWPGWSSSENIGSRRVAAARRVPRLPS